MSGPASATLTGGDASPRWVTPAAAPRLQHRTFASAAAKTAVSYHIYTPEAYDTEPERRFPLLCWLHGSGGGLGGLRPLADYFHGAIRGGKILPMLVVFPNGMELSLWVNSKDGSVPMETVVVKELVPHMDATFRTLAGREGRMVEGFSMGGYGAARIGFEHHELFAAVSILAGGPLQREFTESPRVDPRRREQVFQAVFGGDMEYFRAQSPWVLAEENATVLAGGTRIRMVIGEEDEMLEVNQLFHDHLTRLGIPHAFSMLPGVGHAPMAVLKAMGEEKWGFYTPGGLAPTPPPPPPSPGSAPAWLSGPDPSP